MTHLLAAAAESNSGVPALVFPIVAAALFLLFGLITWSFRDVAYRHSNKFESTSSHETGVDEFGHDKL